MRRLSACTVRRLYTHGKWMKRKEPQKLRTAHFTIGCERADHGSTFYRSHSNGKLSHAKAHFRYTNTEYKPTVYTVSIYLLGSGSWLAKLNWRKPTPWRDLFRWRSLLTLERAPQSPAKARFYSRHSLVYVCACVCLFAVQAQTMSKFASHTNHKS